jgi:hypothetical protein
MKAMYMYDTKEAPPSVSRAVPHRTVPYHIVPVSCDQSANCTPRNEGAADCPCQDISSQLHSY